MKPITKNNAPVDFENWKLQTKPMKWNDLLSSPKEISEREEGIFYYSKLELRQSLNDEQGFICAYCMTSIDNSYKTRIDHIKCRTLNPTLIFEYKNLVACCDGGSYYGKNKAASHTLHCDVRKHDNPIEVSPLDLKCHTHFQYDEEGNIYGSTNEGRSTIDILGLNINTLKTQRRTVIENILSTEIELTEKDIENIKNAMLQKTDNRFQPYCQAILYILS